MKEKLNASEAEAQFMSRLVTAWTSAQTVVDQLKPVLEGFGLFKPNGCLNVERVLEVKAKARGEKQ